MSFNKFYIPLVFILSANSYATDLNPGVVSITVDGNSYRVYAQELTTLPDQNFINQLSSTAWFGSFPMRDAVANAYYSASNGYKPILLDEFGLWDVNLGPFVLNQILPESFITVATAKADTATTAELISLYQSFQYWLDSASRANSSLYFLLQTFGPSPADTLNSFRPNAFALRNAYNLQSANITQSLSYDCTVFNAKNICASFSGTRSNQNGSNLDSTTGTLVIAHRPAANVRFGGYINQSLNTSEQGGLRLERSKPGVGAFVNYALTSGLNIRGSVGFGKLDMQTTREALGTAEAGVGKSNITTQGAQLELSKAFDIKAGWTAVPYAGVRKVTNKRAGYSETESDLVSTPLTFADLKQTQTTAFGGMRFLGQIAQQTQLLISAGIEHDSSRKVDDYAASGIDGLGSITMQENVKKTRPMFATSLSYDIAKNERASIGVVHRQEAFDKKRTTSVGFTYMKGF